MRKYAFLTIPLLVFLAWQAPAQSKKDKMPFKVEFDPAQDVERLSAHDGVEGIFIKVRFAITLDGAKVQKFDGDHKLLIEENGRRVMEVDVPHPVVSEALTVMLAMDYSGSMKQHGRMEQARGAAEVFLKKLPAGSDCGLILFDHEIRASLEPMFERPPLLAKINLLEPRGGTAYLDAASASVAMLKNVRPSRDRAVVLMTDGIDLNSKKTIQEVIAEAKAANVRVYTIGIGEPGKLELVNTVLALDHSGSMKPPADDNDTTSKIEALHQAAVRFLDSMSTVGRVSIVPFSTRVSVPWNFRDRSKVPALKIKLKKEFEFDGELEPKGETAIFDATYEAINVLEADNSKGKRAVIGMTDGIDNSSRRRVEEVIARAKDANIALHMLGFGREKEIDDTVMRRMADATGGKYYHAKNKDALIEIFENLSMKLHDDGIDEPSLKQIASETGGQYYPAKNVSELKFILEQVTQGIQRESHEIVFKSLNQRADGAQRNITLKLIQRGIGVDDTVIDEQTGSVFQRGLVVAEMNHVVYLALLAALGGLIVLPTLLRRTPMA